MTLEAIEGDLPNGFHDAVIMKMTHDYEKATIALQVDILMGLPDEVPEDADRYRAAELTFSGVTLCTVETPDAESAFPHPGGIWFKVSDTEIGMLSDAILARLPLLTLKYSFFVLDWHSSINIAAADVEFRWVGADTAK